jgi:LruC domain-containing protein
VPYNPFIFSNRPNTYFSRGTEVHLIDQEPTELVNKTLFGTFQDRSNLLSQLFYRANNNMPFAIHIPTDWQYPAEKANITAAYPNFLYWASSNGAQNKNWYQDLPGNTVKAKIYTK